MWQRDMREKTKCDGGRSWVSPDVRRCTPWVAQTSANFYPWPLWYSGLSAWYMCSLLGSRVRSRPHVGMSSLLVLELGLRCLTYKIKSLIINLILLLSRKNMGGGELLQYSKGRNKGNWVHLNANSMGWHFGVLGPTFNWINEFSGVPCRYVFTKYVKA